ncbi:MAG: hypothetical protein AB8H47_14630 [Bacteroidia bacterium]
MKKPQFSDDDIIRFLYDELSTEKSEAFLAELYTDETLWKRYEALQETAESVSGLQYEPSEQSINNIKAFVRDTADEVVAVQAEPVAPRPSLWQRIPKDLPLKALATVAMALFLGVAVTGSFYTFDQGRKPITSSERPELVQQVVDNDPMFQWDDSEIDRELDEIRRRVQEIETTL